MSSRKNKKIPPSKKNSPNNAPSKKNSPNNAPSKNILPNNTPSNNISPNNAPSNNIDPLTAFAPNRNLRSASRKVQKQPVLPSNNNKDDNNNGSVLNNTSNINRKASRSESSGLSGRTSSESINRTLSTSTSGFKNTLVKSCNDLFQTDKNPTDESMREAIYTALVNEHPDEVEKIEKTKDGWFRCAYENLWNGVDESGNDPCDTYISCITKEVLKSNERTSNNCLFIIAIVDLMFDPNIQTTVLSGESIIKCMAEKAKANEDMELQQKSNELDDEEAENENYKKDMNMRSILIE
ncbi:hypothetical protein GLOIN_2v1840191 [Rhizophagus irregularis DAOM 181602=DAOM 197198]|uniref:Uncharacterized protein n=1 Tax=Rhizophagus irregularis (strain DAOM 181602 / DAOM 197198 / MUCL 43194) TaxID=747089 RepID=A0A2P4Q5M9_RHIID|nr:hypothetical protein GLOIN_2v1840191 [Rhizophagus irregularis DAOM 181602=DAOM 197198]POG72950.1 hypothetical protein GLOIN_2v1840191 [Rhizophagus irregularis DAOM 181602=DAOM 197198]|eukprot:XP_025179816.1 hypothetical protein GLOIN_2v1840191 [Rhizophagus irregularis DAOM 181602=DAOM 197198]